VITEAINNVVGKGLGSIVEVGAGVAGEEEELGVP